MGQKNNRCNCCNSNDNDEYKFENNEKIESLIENPPIQDKNENIKDLKSYVTFKNQSNSISEDISSINENNIEEQKQRYKRKNNLKSSTDISSLETYLENQKSIILIQSTYRSYLYRKKKFPNERIILENETLNKLKQLYNLYLTPNLKNMEVQLGIKHNEDSYKTLLQNAHLYNNNVLYIKELRLFTKLYILKYENIDSFYIGEVNINNELNGRGILMNKNGCKYDGTFEKNKFTGIGKLIDEEGTYLEGYFKDKKIDGRGIKKTLNDTIYIGDFTLGLKEGRGKEETSEHIYEGEFKNDKKNGNGKLYYKNLKDTYTGAFIDNNITGNGNYEWSNGEKYTGNFLNGKMNGKGIYKWPDGGKYEGEYINGIKEGHGIFTWVNGKIFEGPFKNGKPNGPGILTNKNKKYRVFFNDGKIDGKIREIENENEDNSYKSSEDNEKSDLENEDNVESSFIGSEIDNKEKSSENDVSSQNENKGNENLKKIEKMNSIKIKEQKGSSQKGKRDSLVGQNIQIVDVDIGSVKNKKRNKRK